MKKGLNASRDNKETISQVELEVEPLKVEYQIEDTKTGRQPQEPEFTKEEKFVDEYSITKDGPRKVTRLLERFRLNDMVSFALIIAKDIVDSEPRNYKEAMGCKDSAE